MIATMMMMMMMVVITVRLVRMMIKVIFIVPRHHCFLQVGGPQFPISQLKEMGPRKSMHVGVCVG